jgi:hypothetical protein
MFDVLHIQISSVHMKTTTSMVTYVLEVNLQRNTIREALVEVEVNACDV